MHEPDRTPPVVNRTTSGCLMLPGCMGGLFMIVIALSAASYVYSVASSLLAGGPWPDFPIQQTPRDWFCTFCFILSFLALRMLVRKQRGKAAYWLVIACGACWFILAVTSTASSGSLQFGPWQITEPVLSGRIFGGTITGLVLLFYALNRKNRRWHGLS